MVPLLFYPLFTVFLGVVLDSLLGDPRWLPHPIRLLGKAIAHCEQRYNQGQKRALKGALITILLVSCTGLTVITIQLLLASFPWALSVCNGIFLFYGISNRSLIMEGLKVEALLQKGAIEEARQQLSGIVGRETKNLSPSQMRSAVLETLSENLSDGVVAPLFYFMLAGAPGIMMYKMVNTLDSMIGYKNERFADFGYFAAKLDDVLNFLPARLTAATMLILSPNRRAFAITRRFAKQHTSPNAGYPEAALAGILDCTLGGPSTYHGRTVDKPSLGTTPRPLTHADVLTTCRLNAKVAIVWYMGLALLTIFSFFL